MATPMELNWLSNLPGMIRSAKQKVVVMAFDEHTSKAYPNGRFMVALQPSGNMSWVKFEDMQIEPKALLEDRELEAPCNGPPCLMCGRPQPGRGPDEDDG